MTQSAPTTQARTVQRTVRSPRPVSPATVTRRSTPDPRPRTPLQQPALQEVPRQDPRAVHYIQTPVTLRAGPPSPEPMRHSPRLELQPEPLQSGCHQCCYSCFSTILIVEIRLCREYYPTCVKDQAGPVCKLHRRSARDTSADYQRASVHTGTEHSKHRQWHRSL